MSRLTAQEGEQRHNRGSGAPTHEPALNPPSTPRSTPNSSSSSSSNSSMQGQMCAALGGPEGMVAITEAMQVAFHKHAQKARFCYCLLDYQALQILFFSTCVHLCLHHMLSVSESCFKTMSVNPVSVCVSVCQCVQQFCPCCIRLGFCGLGVSVCIYGA